VLVLSKPVSSQACKEIREFSPNISNCSLAPIRENYWINVLRLVEYSRKTVDKMEKYIGCDLGGIGVLGSE
jgi:hypothetical protein